MGSLFDVKTRNELADVLYIPRRHLTYILYIQRPDNCYTTFEIPKKFGGIRVISAPSSALKEIQVTLAEKLWECQQKIWQQYNIQPNIAHAFIPKKSTITNAQIHCKKRYVLNLDLKDFFDHFHFGRVMGYFEKNNNFCLPHEVAVIITQLACYKGRLPQGAPTSPIITNLICQILDMHLLSIAKKYKVDYTRYADDLTFSTNRRTFEDDISQFLVEIQREVQGFGFEINEKKTRLQFRNSRQEVTGLIVNKKLNVPHLFYKNTRAMANQLYKTGHFYIDSGEGTLNQLEGRFSYIDQLTKYNNRLDGEKHSQHLLSTRERQYQKFLFYKYFFANPQPLLVTEGKTDEIYLKAAIRSLGREYPALAKLDSTGNYICKCRFFHRSRRLEYFFDISYDGADAMKNIYNLHTGKNGFPPYLSFFTKASGHTPQNPTILLYDNETKSNRPLNKFFSYIGADRDTPLGGLDYREALQKNLYLQLLKESKLYLATVPLTSGKAECEIEDLFPDDVLAVQINGKTFSRKDTFDISLYYGKNIFAQYVNAHWQEIDFSGFRPLLDALQTIVLAQESILLNA